MAFLAVFLFVSMLYGHGTAQTQSQVAPCVDHDSRCSLPEYQQICKDPDPLIVQYNTHKCPLSCNLCKEYGTTTMAPQTTTNAHTGTTTLPPCEDHDPGCSFSIYSSILCNPATAPETKAYAIKTCPKTCNYCNEYYAPAKCHVCGNSANQIPCGQIEILTNVSANMVTCSTEKFCMTDVFNDGRGNDYVFKRCVDEQTCRTKWIAESADQDYCNKFGTVIPANAFECHFCCQGDFCNTNIMPQMATLVPRN